MKDASGKTSLRAGSLRPDGYLDPSAHSFSIASSNSCKGGIQRPASGSGNRVLILQQHDSVKGAASWCTYGLPCPRDATGSISITRLKA